MDYKKRNFLEKVVISQKDVKQERKISFPIDFKMSGFIPNFSGAMQQQIEQPTLPPPPPSEQQFILYPLCPPQQVPYPPPSQFPVSLSNLHQILIPLSSSIGQPQTPFGQNVMVLPAAANNFVSSPQNYQNSGFQQSQMIPTSGIQQTTTSYCGGNQSQMLPQVVGGCQCSGQVPSQGNYTYVEMAQYYPSQNYNQSPSPIQPANINYPPPTSIQSLILPQPGTGMQFIRAFTSQQQQETSPPLLNPYQSGNKATQNFSFPPEPKKLSCGFCKSNRASKDIYGSHDLKNEVGVITCPVLRKYECPICKRSGDEAHTLKYCPESQNQNRNPVEVVQRRVKNSTGKSYILKY